MTVRFTLLGGTAACADGGRLALGPPRQRVVLAVLLIEANREVAVEELEQRVWGDDPPPRARASLYSYLSRLRRLPADVTLTRGPGGYRLAVDPEQVDVHLFRSLLERAQATDDPSAALALLDRALRLWQGEPLARYDTPWLNAWRDTLSQNRAAAELDRNDLRLELGQHAAMLADLTAGAAASPLDERLAGQLVLCLHRCGRTAEALEVYRRTRAHLVEELGIEPGRYLQACQQQILTAPEPSPAQASVPRQLPAPPLAFVGRATELRELARALEPRTATARAGRVCAISGPGGSGKTWLALRAAHDQLPAFPDGQLHVNLRGYAPSAQPLPPATALGTLLRGLGVGDGDIPADEDARGALFRSLTADRRLLVVLDNARNSDQVTPLLPGGTGSAVLVTSRSRLTGLLTAHGARPVVLDLLAPDDARRLLGSHLGEARIAAEPQAVEAVVASCAGLPLALSIVAARAVERPGSALAAVAAELADRQYRLDAFNGGDAASDLRAVFSWSYRCLDDGAARLFRLLGANPGAEIGVHALAGLAALPLREVRVLVAELAQAHLVFEVSPVATASTTCSPPTPGSWPQPIRSRSRRAYACSTTTCTVPSTPIACSGRTAAEPSSTRRDLVSCPSGSPTTVQPWTGSPWRAPTCSWSWKRRPGPARTPGPAFWRSSSAPIWPAGAAGTS
ncbi:BTAD domain-containing putative transcriptional regulator [Kitasatospora gansuensis]